MLGVKSHSQSQSQSLRNTPCRLLFLFLVLVVFSDYLGLRLTLLPPSQAPAISESPRNPHVLPPKKTGFYPCPKKKNSKFGLVRIGLSCKFATLTSAFLRRTDAEVSINAGQRARTIQSETRLPDHVSQTRPLSFHRETGKTSRNTRTRGANRSNLKRRENLSCPSQCRAWLAGSWTFLDY